MPAHERRLIDPTAAELAEALARAAGAEGLIALSFSPTGIPW